MNPNYTHTVTLYHRQADGTYTRQVLEGVSWKAETAVTQSGTQAGKTNTYTVRIPAEAVPDGLAVSLNNDIVVHGECSDVIGNTVGSRAAEVLARYKPEAFKVTAFSDNTSHMTDKHYRLGG